ncbi:TetR/AcrR family transcriptional regulator [Ktedonosporobacter rubrisoli]|uniref:TetR/AcrR family transcriptional regulator n=1 Tax=Ktedonosporobacter rubrisoli TaxID=2509675 RepID=A0A4P6K215_KTERU|nr:TetR/AcrR family transcriptional regulator [Ktedonosporobacter rubrisoli]QBD81740.1 TetR/AcrR family transcriptional regulator [Ktedonosporobacter rubrisoli]
MASRNQKSQQPVEPIWLRLARPRQKRQSSLSHEQIIRAALELADTEGTRALSMRRLATKLGAGTMSLYWYISSKEDLLDLLMDAAFGELELPERPSDDWRAGISIFALQTRAVMLRHPWLASLLGTRPGLGPHWLKRFEFFLAAMDNHDLTMTEIARIFSLVDGYVIGFVMRELEENETIRLTGVTREEWRATINPYIQQLITSGNHPYLARYLLESEESPIEENFTFGLDRLLDGIAAYIAEYHP